MYNLSSEDQKPELGVPVVSIDLNLTREFSLVALVCFSLKSAFLWTQKLGKVEVERILNVNEKLSSSASLFFFPDHCNLILNQIYVSLPVIKNVSFPTDGVMELFFMKYLLLVRISAPNCFLLFYKPA